MIDLGLINELKKNLWQQLIYRQF